MSFDDILGIQLPWEDEEDISEEEDQQIGETTWDTDNIWNTGKLPPVVWKVDGNITDWPDPLWVLKVG